MHFSLYFRVKHFSDLYVTCGPLHNSYADVQSSGVTGGAGRRVPPPPTFFTGKFLLTHRENRGKETRENGGEKKEREGGKLKMEGGTAQRTFFFFFFFAVHFSKPLKFVWGVPKWKISTGKKHISCRENSG